MMQDVLHTLLNGQTSDAAAGAAKENAASTEVYWHGGERLIVVGGTFDGATVALKLKPSSVISAYVGASDLEWTEPGLKVAYLPGSGFVSASVTGAGGSTSVSMTVQRPGVK